MSQLARKCCTRCKVEKPLEDYSTDKRALDGRQSRCKDCSNAVKREKREKDLEGSRLKSRKYYAANKARYSAYGAKSRIKNREKIKKRKREEYLAKRNDPEFIARLREYTRKASARKREYDRRYRRENAERLSKIKSAWREENAELIKQVKRAYKHRRRALESGGVSGRELADWAERQVKKCYWCNVQCEKNYHIDHYQPLARGGSHELDNLVIACPTCNQRKSANDPYEFARSQGRLF